MLPFLRVLILHSSAAMSATSGGPPAASAPPRPLPHARPNSNLYTGHDHVVATVEKHRIELVVKVMRGERPAQLLNLEAWDR
jgi:hypothetical protein